MPVPKPREDENHDDFIDRCMSNELMNNEFPDSKQRFAVCQINWEHKERSMNMNIEEMRKVISYQAAHGEIGYSEDAWDGPKNEANLKNDGDAAYYKKAFAYVDPEANPDTKTAYKFIHHEVGANGTIGAANLKACSAGIAILNGGRGGTNIPKEEYQGVYNHLAQHLKDADREAPELKRSKVQKYETRTITLNSEDIKADEKIYAKIASFNSLSQVINRRYRERIAPGAFRKTLQESDIRALQNHNENYVLGRTKSGTIKLEEREDGLYLECIPPDTQWARDLMVSIKRGDIDQCSFGFRMVKDTYSEEDNQTIRTLQEVELFDVSIVTYPAYLNTSANVRSLNRSEVIQKLINGDIEFETVEKHLRSLLTEPENNIHSNNKSGEPFNKTLIRERELQIFELRKDD
jgi:HK97 family phage prohead protease